MSELPDTKSILGNLAVMPELPDTKSILGNLAVMPELPDTKSILGNLAVMPELPDTKSILGNLTVMRELSDLQSAFESLRVVPDLMETYEVVQTLLDERDSSWDFDSTSIPEASPSSNHLSLRVGFDVRLESAPMPQPLESVEAYATPDPQHWMVFCELERRLRILVRDQLTSLAASDWIKQRVPEDVRERWYERQGEDRAANRQVHEPIEYADFMDLPKIITRSGNWRDVFQAIFLDCSEVLVSFRRLNPIRKALAHSRPLSKVDVLTLTAESTWILGRHKIRVLH